MVRYIFKLRDDDRLTGEPVAQGLCNFEATRAEALAAARSLLAGKVWAGKMLDGQQSELWDDVGRMLATV
jgi:hypothetical protein